MQKLYADTGTNAGKITTIANNWPIGYALGPVNTPNAVGYACWIDFTMGFGAVGIPGPPGPQGPPGPAGTAGTGGGGGTVSNSGQCHFRKIGTNCCLVRHQGCNLIILAV
jgi:hypothetical protein